MYILLNGAKPVHVTTESPWVGCPTPKDFFVNGLKIEYTKSRAGIIDRHNMEHMTAPQINKLVAQLRELDGQNYIATFNHEGKKPEIIIGPIVGADVSYGGNGDYYPAGKIVKITPTYRITTDTGAKFSRVRKSGAWKHTNGFGHMVSGVVNRLSQEF